jgi:antitoxin component YwqK of YwqJK toxin-antitoxin module
VHAQPSVKFHDLIEKTEDGKIKIYLDAVFRISFKGCADYYLIADFDDTIFQFKDSIKVFYRNGDLFITGAYRNGKLDGKFYSYYRNGMKKMEFEYDLGNRIGTWESFSKDGKLIKKVLYKDGKEFLAELRRGNGKILVSDGNGKFIDELYTSVSGHRKSKIFGNVKNGLPDGEWDFYVEYVIYGKEYFENGVLQKGVSISGVFGDNYYYDHSNATFTGIMFLEHLKIIGPSVCNGHINIGLNYEFYQKIKKEFYDQKLNKLISDSWYYIEIQTGKKKEITNVSVISKADDKSIALIRELIFSLKKVTTISSKKVKPGYCYFPVVISDSTMYTQSDKEFDLLKFKF